MHTSDEDRPPLRVGTVPYLVGRPLDWGLDSVPGIRLEKDTPARLVERLRAGQVDVALVSSIELFRQPGYRYISDLAVAGQGFVASVQVFLRKALTQVRSVALDPSSRTAAALVRVLLDPASRSPLATEVDGGHESIRFVEVPTGEDPRQAGTDAWLRIGDAALREYLAPAAPDVFNPSRAWFERTGLPFIFATWIVRPGVRVEPHLDAFYRARMHGVERLNELAERASREWNLPLEACRKYLCEECRYDAGAGMDAALLAFRDAAAKVGLCRADLQPEAIRVAAIGGAAQLPS